MEGKTALEQFILTAVKQLKLNPGDNKIYCCKKLTKFKLLNCTNSSVCLY